MENSNELEVVGVGILRTGKNWEITAKRVTYISFLFLISLKFFHVSQ